MPKMIRPPSRCEEAQIIAEIPEAFIGEVGTIERIRQHILACLGCRMSLEHVRNDFLDNMRHERAVRKARAQKAWFQALEVDDLHHV